MRSGTSLRIQIALRWLHLKPVFRRRRPNPSVSHALSEPRATGLDQPVGRQRGGRRHPPVFKVISIGRRSPSRCRRVGRLCARPCAGGGIAGRVVGANPYGSARPIWRPVARARVWKASSLRACEHDRAAMALPGVRETIDGCGWDWTTGAAKPASPALPVRMAHATGLVRSSQVVRETRLRRACQILKETSAASSTAASA